MSLHNFFFCPASGSLNQHNETGSIGQISYEFLAALSRCQPNSSITAVVFDTYATSSFANVTILPKNQTHKLDAITSLKFYLWSVKYYFDSRFRRSQIIQHFMPFSPGITFNPLFFLKNSQKKYIIGPLLGTHVNTQLFKTDDHKSSFSPLNLLSRISPLFFGWLNQLTFKYADVILFSDDFARQCYSKYLLPHHQIQILPIGIDQSIFKPAPKKAHSKLKILFVGRLTERKGCQYLIEALNKLTFPFTCDIFGSGPQEAELKQLAKSKNIVFHGRFDQDKDIVSYYQQVDVVVCPALSDTWVTAKQALSCGTPVIITNIASHPEIVQDYVNGFLIPIQDSKSIINKLSLLAKDQVLLTKLSNNAARLASDRYNWDKIITEYFKILDA